MNVAIGRPAWQSSTLRHDTHAGNAVDGYDGDENRVNCSSTKGFRWPAWWTVDLLTEYFIQMISITPLPLEGVSSGRLAGYSVLISKTEKDNDYITCFDYGKNAILPNVSTDQEIVCQTPLRGRYVKITQSRNNPPYPEGYSEKAYLELCEVKIFVDSSQIATGKSATQSTTFTAFIANNSIDGNQGTIYMSGCSHTGRGQLKAWWKVDLGDSFLIQNIIITPRPLDTPETRGRLAGFEVSVSENKNQNFNVCFRYGKTDILPDIRVKQIVSCYPPVPGRYVQISNDRSNPPYRPGYSQYAFVNMCEVEVIAEDLHSECPYNCKTCNCTNCLTGFYGLQCQRNCKNCGGNGSCDKHSGECVHKSCNIGYYGIHCNLTCGRSCIANTCDYYSGHCERCPLHCILCESPSNCSECERNWYGNLCNKSCLNCGNYECDKYGTCSSNHCKPGYFGEQCRAVCSDQCLGNGSCNINTGVCGLCPEGFYGVNCELKCPTSCMVCENWSNCLKCKTGWYGHVCDMQCPHCGGDGSCKQQDGYCFSNSCRAGYYSGEKGSCRNMCSRTCANDGSCNMLTGQCVFCYDGFWGPTCHLRCPFKCHGNGSCERWTSKCSSGCIDGYYGERCEFRCLPICGGNRSCSQIEGNCFNVVTSKSKKANISNGENNPYGGLFSIIGGALGGIGSLMLMILLAFILMRRLINECKRKNLETSVCMTARSLDSRSEEEEYSDIQALSRQTSVIRASFTNRLRCNEDQEYEDPIFA